MLIDCSNSKQVLTNQGMQALKKYTSKLKPGEQFFLKPVSKAEARSVQQSKYYWSVIMPAMQYYCEFLDFCPDPKQDRMTAHFMSKLQYCMLERNDLIEKVKIRNPIDKKMVTRHLPFSWSFENMPKKEAQAYLDWCIKMIEKFSHVGLKLALESMS